MAYGDEVIAGTNQQPASQNEAQEIEARFKAADDVRRLWVPLMDDCHRYALPMRDTFYYQNEGQRRTDRIFDSTAVNSIQEFASRLQAGLTPNYSKWALFEPGPDVPAADKPRWKQALEDINDLFFEIIHASNFNAMSHECYLDVGVGTAVMLVEEGDPALHPINFTSIPNTQVWLEASPFGGFTAVFRPISVPVEMIQHKWRDAKLTPELLKMLREEPRKPVSLLEATILDPDRRDTEVWKYRVLAAGQQEAKEIIVRREFDGEGSCPWIPFRWSTCAGETLGRGPLMQALPDIKTANLIVELVLENAEVAIAGMWQYDDDGVVDPNTVALVPGAMIPRGMQSRGLEPLQSGAEFNIGLKDILPPLQASIKRALFDEMLGPVDKTPMSAAEVHVRMAEMARRIGSPYGRINYEFIQPLVQRGLYILKKQGRIQLPRVGKKHVKVVPTSPLARQQKYAVEVQSIEQYLQIIMQSFGPQMLNIVVDAGKTAGVLADDLGVPSKIIRTDAEKKAIVAQIAQLAAAAQQPAQQPPQQAQ